jgi:phospholipid/cholesterol/gamma-HCH transport system substrate-binding protein
VKQMLTMRLGNQMRESVFETLVGLAVLAVAGFFLWFAMVNSNNDSGGDSDVLIGVRLSAASGVEPGTDVKMAGVKIGTVRDIEIDFDRTEALVTMVVDDRILPIGDGTSARVQGDGLLGGSYIGLEPAEGCGEIEMCGTSDQLFGDTGCSELLYGQGSVDLLTLFASFASGSGDSSGDSE